MRSSGIGGQAVIEGVMMKNKNQYAVSVRKPDQGIEVKVSTFVSFSEKYKLMRLPIVRGIVAFVESLVLGMKTLTFSASFFEEEEEVNMVKKPKSDSLMMGLTVAFSIIMAVGIFMILPYIISGLFFKRIDSFFLLTVIEGAIRILLFVGYVLAISQIKDIKRVFMYHGAEHKTINCLEHGYDLTVENVKKQSKEHKRCGTSFMLVVMVVSIVIFFFIRVPSPLAKVILRILLVPLIAGISYEFIRFAGNSDSNLIGILSRPGMWLQHLTTKEPDADMIEVAIRSVEAVFDWKSYLDLNRERMVKNS